MVVLLTAQEILSTGQVCRHCLLANEQGEPRLQNGRVRCGRSARSASPPSTTAMAQRCPMGFRVVDLPSPAT